jgi:hypothetical protein
VSGINQGGVLTKQSVAVFKAVGPTTNKKTVLANTAGRWLGLRDSVAESEVKKATDTWWPSKLVHIICWCIGARASHSVLCSSSLCVRSIALCARLNCACKSKQYARL